MLELVIIPVFALHLACVNLAAGGPLVAIGLAWQEGNGDETAGDAGRWLAGVSLGGLVAGGVLGVLLGALTWPPGAVGEVWRRLDSRLSFGIAEIVFSLALHAGFWLWWKWGPLTEFWQKGLHRSLAVLSATNLLYHFPPLFAIAGRVARGEWAGPNPILSPEFRGLLLKGSILSQSVHFLLASIAVAGVAVLLWTALRRQSRGADEKPDAEAASLATLARQAAWIGLIPTVLQAIVGLWVFTSLPEPMQYRLVGQNPLALVIFGLSLAAALWLAHDLLATTASDEPTAHGRSSTLLMAATILLMTATLRLTQMP